jgi:hypothetical protein
VLRERLGAGPVAYVVKSGWQGEVASLRGSAGLGVALEPEVDFPPLIFSHKGLSFSVEDGRLTVDYATDMDRGDTLVDLHLNELQDWKASLQGKNTSVSMRGNGMDLKNMSWETAQESTVKGIGDMRLEFNSDKEYNLTVVRPHLATTAGFDLDAKALATDHGVAGYLGARAELAGGAELTYSVQNPIGVYDFGASRHKGRLSTPMGGGEAILQVEGYATGQVYQGSYTKDVKGGRLKLAAIQADGTVGYNVSYARMLDDVIKRKTEADVQVGVDTDGVYGAFAARKPVRGGFDAQYEAHARFNKGEEDGGTKVTQHLKLSNKFGFAQLLHGSGEAPRLRVGYQFEAKDATRRGGRARAIEKMTTRPLDHPDMSELYQWFRSHDEDKYAWELLDEDGEVVPL